MTFGGSRHCTTSKSRLWNRLGKVVGCPRGGSLVAAKLAVVVLVTVAEGAGWRLQRAWRFHDWRDGGVVGGGGGLCRWRWPLLWLLLRPLGWWWWLPWRRRVPVGSLREQALGSKTRDCLQDRTAGKGLPGCDNTHRFSSFFGDCNPRLLLPMATARLLIHPSEWHCSFCVTDKGGKINPKKAYDKFIALYVGAGQTLAPEWEGDMLFELAQAGKPVTTVMQQARSDHLFVELSPLPQRRAQGGTFSARWTARARRPSIPTSK